MASYRSIAIFFVIQFFTIPSHTQILNDSLVHVKDSIQDKQIENNYREIRYLHEKWDHEHTRMQQTIDSLALHNMILSGNIELLRNEKSELDDRIGILQDQMVVAENDAEAYRKRLGTILWISGPFIVLLLLASLTIFFIYVLDRNRKINMQLQSFSEEVKSDIHQFKESISFESKRNLQKMHKRLLKDVQKDIRKNTKKIVIDYLIKKFRKLKREKGI